MKMNSDNGFSSEDEAPTPPKKSKIIKDSSSSSESDIESYLHKPQDLKLNSTFFQVNNQVAGSCVKKQQVALVDANKGTLSDSDSDDPLDIYVTHKNKTHKKKVEEEEASCSLQDEYVFKDLNKQAQELEEARQQVEAYIAKRKAEMAKNEDGEIDDLLAMGEKPFDLAKDLAEVGFHPSDFESGGESDKDWEEVQDSQEQRSIIPKNGVQITLELPSVFKKKKGIDLMAALKRRMNRIKKEDQVFVHKVHLLCWIAHGNYVNAILNRDGIMCLALSLLPSKDCYPPERSNLKYLEQITTWYHKAMKYKPEVGEQDGGDLEDKLMDQIATKVATSANVLVYVFIAMLRALGLQCRLVVSVDVAPLRPPQSELCSLKVKVEEKDVKSEDVVKEKKIRSKSASKVDEVAKTKKLEVSGGTKKERAKRSKSAEVPARLPKVSAVSKDKEKGSEKMSVKQIPKKSPEKGKPNLNKLKSISDDDDFREDANCSKSVKSLKSLPSAPKTNAKSTRSKKTPPSKMEKSIDKTLATLEALERPQTRPQTRRTKPNLRNLKVKSTTTEDDDEEFGDRAAWRRSKSTLQPSPAATKNKSKVEATTRQTRSRKRPPSPKPNSFLLDSDFTDDEIKPKQKGLKFKIPKRKVPQVDGHMDSSDSDDSYSISQLDGADDKEKPSKLKLKMTSLDDDKQRTPFTRKRHSDSPTINKLRSSSKPSPKSSPSTGSATGTATASKLFTTQPFDIKDDIIKLVKANVRANRSNAADSDSDSDYMPEESPSLRKKPTPKVKMRVLPRSQLEALAQEKAEMQTKRTKGIDIWVEVFLEDEEKWISADVVNGKVHCIKELYTKASHPVAYILSWDNASRIKDVTKRYCPNWNTVTRKQRIDSKWWQASLRSYIGKKTARDREEDEDLARQQLDQPLPKTITEFKDHPLYVLKRHLLKFQAIYPPDAAILGFVRKEEVYSRDCVYTLHSRDIWLKHAKTVRRGQQPYKIVKARPKWDKLSNAMITDQLLEIFGEWQVEDYDPPTAENGVVPRNAYGNVELFKPCMLPKKCVHLQLPGLNKIARKLNIDCATAVVGFDFHGGWNHAVYDGFVVCEEHKDTLIVAWEEEQGEIVKREQEKYEKRVFGNWRRLIKAAFIRERLKLRYDFGAKDKEASEDEGSEESQAKSQVASPPVVEEKKKKRPKFMSRK